MLVSHCWSKGMVGDIQIGKVAQFPAMFSHDLQIRLELINLQKMCSECKDYFNQGPRLCLAPDWSTVSDDRIDKWIEPNIMRPETHSTSNLCGIKCHPWGEFQKVKKRVSKFDETAFQGSDNQGEGKAPALITECNLKFRPLLWCLFTGRYRKMKSYLAILALLLVVAIDASVGTGLADHIPEATLKKYQDDNLVVSNLFLIHSSKNVPSKTGAWHHHWLDCLFLLSFRDFVRLLASRLQFVGEWQIHYLKSALMICLMASHK